MVRLLPCRNRLFAGFISTHLLILWTTVCCPIASVHARSQLAHQAPEFTLTNQFGHQTTLHFPQPTPISLLFSDRHSHSLAGPCVEALTAIPVPIRTITVACIGGIPTILQPMLRKAFSQDKPVLPGWNDATARQHGYSGGFLLVLISPTGRIVTTETAAYSPARLPALIRLFP